MLRVPFPPGTGRNVLTRETSVAGPQKEGDVWAASWKGKFDFLRAPFSLFQIEKSTRGKCYKYSSGGEAREGRQRERKTRCYLQQEHLL